MSGVVSNNPYLPAALDLSKRRIKAPPHLAAGTQTTDLDCSSQGLCRTYLVSSTTQGFDASSAGKERKGTQRDARVTRVICLARGAHTPEKKKNAVMSNNATLDDEVLSLNSIYGDDTLSAPVAFSSASSSSSAAAAGEAEDEAGGLEAVLRLPHQPSVSLRIFFPAAYPDDPPFVLGTHSVGSGELPRGAGQVIVRVARETLARVFSAAGGGPCLFDLAEELGESLPKALEDAHLLSGQSLNEGDVERLQDSAVPREGEENGATGGGGSGGLIGTSKHGFHLGEPPAWVLSDVITEKKSVFLGRSTAVSSVDEAQCCISHLLATDKRAAKATHNISAWRIRGNEGDATFQDFDDDGETAAGGRLLKLLQMMDVWNVVVVVSRWYGGIHLGPARFAIINEAARDAVGKLEEEQGATGKAGNVKNAKARKR